jgi:hypothetical protein
MTGSCARESFSNAATPASSLPERSTIMVSKRSPSRFQAIRGYALLRAGIMGRDAEDGNFRSRTGARAMRSSGYLQLCGVVLLWSVNIILVKAALPDIPPFALTSLRFAGAVGLFAVIARVLRIPIVPIPGERIRLAAIGMVQIGLVTALTAVGLSYLSAGRATIVIYTMQIWALPLGYWIADDGLTRVGVMGVAVASAGLAMFLSPWLVDWTESQAAKRPFPRWQRARFPPIPYRSPFARLPLRSESRFPASVSRRIRQRSHRSAPAWR